MGDVILGDDSAGEGGTIRPGEPVGERGIPALPRAVAGVAAEAARCLGKAVEFAVQTQNGDGAWYVPSEPRILENAAVACSLAGVEQARAARERAVRWLEHAAPQQHDAFVAAADRWLVGLHRTPVPAAFTAPPSCEGPYARRALYLDALACAAGAPGADARRLLDQARTALGADRGRGVKPWQRAMLLAFEAIACSALGLPLPASTLPELARAQSPDGSFFGMPLVTGVLQLALTRVAPDRRMTLRCRESLLAAQHPDGTWRFCVSEIWDTGLMVRALRGHPRFDTAALPAASDFLAAAQRQDGGWACTAVLDSDNDTTGNTLLALAGTGPADRVRAAATRYAQRHQTPEGLWNTWDSSDDSPVPDVVAHMVAGIRAAELPGIELARAERWLSARATGDGWISDWYIPPAYGAAEIGTAVDAPPGRSAAARALLASQRPDGGWPRIPGEPYSSPTATGLALTALTAHPAEDVGTTDAAVAHGLGFLADTQNGDGTWSDRPVMYGPRPFLTVSGAQVHALVARGLRDALAAAGHSGGVRP
ncbi:prenyltransferase/squalene oxidase repeat-containing protein [Streptomyces sp. NPDC093097]|uniref:prenyltransferase/squalene oxidase repeat-containing protein n=1 Tax=Streptomyces sp. NPDC093097 TaxID=3366027 RepID=UPI0037FA8014